MNPQKVSQFRAFSQTTCFIVLLIAALFSYLYFLNKSVVDVVMRKQAIEEQALLRAEIAQLESEFIVAQHNIANRIATVEGFNFDFDKVFIIKTDDSVALRSN